MTRRSLVLILALAAAALLPLHRAPALASYTGVCTDLEVTMTITTPDGNPVPMTSTSPDETSLTIPAGSPGQAQGECRMVDTTLTFASIDISGQLFGLVSCLGVQVDGVISVTLQGGGVNEYFDPVFVSMIGSLEFAEAELHALDPAESFVGVGTMRAAAGTVQQCATGGVSSGQPVVFEGTLAFDP